MKNQTKFPILTLLLMGIVILLTNSCEKDDEDDNDNNNNRPTVQIPVITTTAVSNITLTSANSGGNITSDGGSTITARGVCWSTNQTPTIADNKTSDGTGAGSFTSNITGIYANTTYYVRAYATNSAGTGYGSAMSFSTPMTVTDIDGNIYHTITIGTQIWMVENLKTTKYRDGTSIPNVTNATSWSVLSTGAYADYDNNPANSTDNGKLYNWYVVTDTRNIAPVGWHIPSEAEWTLLENYLTANGFNYDGSVTGNKFAKSLAALSSWSNSSIQGAVCNTDYPDYRNKSGFTAYASGYRYITGVYDGICNYGSWWSTNENNTTEAWSHYLYYNDINMSKVSRNKTYGFSIRCIKD